MPFFTDDVFKDFVKQYKNGNTLFDGWEFYMKNEDYQVYRRPAHDRNPNLYEYRAIGGWKDVRAATLAHVYLDLDFREKWDKNMKSHQRFTVADSANAEDHYDGLHFEIKYPWPLANRDYVYAMEKRVVRDDETSIDYQVILGESLLASSFPQTKGVVRIDTYKQNICLHPTEDGNGCYVFMDYFDDPKGNIPKSVINWAAKTAVPMFINSLKDACKLFEETYPNKVPSLEHTC
ncbi:hypothetical protein BDF20DRAFT_624943 [Mycotypha africana]|uniref:uncharacterized protein n=1 Tax=Mycotypha africana TaxID=64632 RepID=UPI00230055B8|nr:uncharacterized protein BDF20DRAFT_624943 [Mycotypha africana]KAI8975687.1 hypothetical protein BDF20DRAFT_624943 [Mycotypha africana]